MKRIAWNKGKCWSKKVKDNIRKGILNGYRNGRIVWNKNKPFMRGKNHPLWNGGKFIGDSGYVFIFSPQHPYRTNRCYMREHRLVMEKHLGRFLKPTERIHHKNGIKTDNRLSNLLLFSSESEHQKFEWSLK